jgi:hypothetical protein
MDKIIAAWKKIQSLFVMLRVFKELVSPKVDSIRRVDQTGMFAYAKY